MFKNRFPVALLLVMAIGVPAAAGAATLTEKFDRTYPLAASGKVLLSNVNGHVNVRVWDRPEVRVQAEKRVESRNEAEARKVLRSLAVDVRASQGRLDIATRGSNSGGSLVDWLIGTHVDASVAYEVLVPRKVDVSVNTVNGHVDVAGVTGEVDVETTNGGVNINQVAGKLDASTTNGGIRVQLANVTMPVDLSTTNGGISLALPSGLKANLDASTTNGSIHCELPVAVSGTVNNSEIRGEINGGGIPLRLRTTNGGIRLTRLGS